MESLAASRKAEAVVAKLKARELSRKKNAAEYKDANRDVSRSDEAIESFLDVWRNAEEGCRDMMTHGREGANMETDQKSLLWQSSCQEDIQKLEKELNRGMSFLPSYHATACGQSLQSLRQDFEASKSKAAPKKKFSFAGKKSRTDASGPYSLNNSDLPARPRLEPISAAERSTPDNNGDSQDPSADHGPQQNDEQQQRSIENLKGVTTVRDIRDASGAALCSIRNLQDSNVKVQGPLAALRLENCQSCTVWVESTIAGPAFCTGIQGCQVIISAAQVRIHKSSGTDFFLDVTSNPIIEDCSGLRFAPNPQLRQTASARPESEAEFGSGNWNNVQDFGWLRSSASPNW